MKRLISCVAFSLLVAACGPAISMTRGSMVPAADAAADVTTDDNGNAKVKLSVTKLAAPGRLEGGYEHYIVWAMDVDDDNKAHKLGKIAVDDDGDGEFEANVPVKNFTVVISAEKDESPEGPSDARVFVSSEVDVN